MSGFLQAPRGKPGRETNYETGCILTKEDKSFKFTFLAQVY
jgi:hypothetical protein